MYQLTLAQQKFYACTTDLLAWAMKQNIGLSEYVQNEILEGGDSEIVWHTFYDAGLGLAWQEARYNLLMLPMAKFYVGY